MNVMNDTLLLNRLPTTKEEEEGNKPMTMKRNHRDEGSQRRLDETNASGGLDWFMLSNGSLMSMMGNGNNNNYNFTNSIRSSSSNITKPKKHQRTSSVDIRKDFSLETWTSLLDLLHFSEYFVTVNNFSIWRRHLSWGMPEGADLRTYLTQRYASNMVFMSLLLGTELSTLFNSAHFAVDIRKALQDYQQHGSLLFFIGLVILISIFLTFLSLLSTFTAWSMVSAISNENSHCLLRSSIGQYAAELPQRFIVTSIYSFLLWITLFIFYLLPPFGVWCLLLASAIVGLFFHVVTVFSAFGRIILHTGAMAPHRIFEERYEESLLPISLHSNLLKRAKAELSHQTSITRQYKRKMEPLNQDMSEEDMSDRLHRAYQASVKAPPPPSKTSPSSASTTTTSTFSSSTNQHHPLRFETSSRHHHRSESRGRMPAMDDNGGTSGGARSHIRTDSTVRFADQLFTNIPDRHDQEKDKEQQQQQEPVNNNNNKSNKNNVEEKEKPPPLAEIATAGPPSPKKTSSIPSTRDWLAIVSATSPWTTYRKQQQEQQQERNQDNDDNSHHSILHNNNDNQPINPMDESFVQRGDLDLSLSKWSNHSINSNSSGGRSRRVEETSPPPPPPPPPSTINSHHHDDNTTATKDEDDEDELLDLEQAESFGWADLEKETTSFGATSASLSHSSSSSSSLTTTTTSPSHSWNRNKQRARRRPPRRPPATMDWNSPPLSIMSNSDIPENRNEEEDLIENEKQGLLNNGGDGSSQSERRHYSTL